jgi:SAM-dependent methyltransferase
MIRKWLRYVYWRFWVLPPLHRANRSRSIAETFQEIYRSRRWGDNGGAFFSGAGSHGPISEQYAAAAIEFIRENRVRSVADLGCGDFAVGRRIVEASGVAYTGLDVVAELIAHHKSTVRLPGVEFQCADITTDPLPEADLCLIRQVFQHLSNDEIAKVLKNAEKYPRILVSEEVPNEPMSYNRDKPHGYDVRSYCGSGVFLEKPPFSRAVKELWNIPLDRRSVLRTVLLENKVIYSGKN